MPSRAGNHFVLESRLQVVEEGVVAGEQTGLQERGAHGHVVVRRLQRLVYGTRRMPDLQPQIPEHVEDVFGDALRPGGLLPGKKEEEVDIGMRRERPAAVTANRN